MTFAEQCLQFAERVGQAMKGLDQRVSVLESVPSFIYGTEADGAFVLDGQVEVEWADKYGTYYVLKRDVHFTDLTISHGCGLITAGFRVFGTGLLTNHSALGTLINAAVNEVGAVPRTNVSYGAGGSGANGTLGLPGVEADKTGFFFPSAGGKGGDSSSINGIEGGKAVSPKSWEESGLSLYFFGIFPFFLNGLLPGSYEQVRGGVGGSSGGAEPGGVSGAGGGGGYCTGIFFKKIIGDGSIFSTGGDGGNASSGNAGGGGGGAGGVLCIVTREPTSIATNVLGGMGGNGSGTGQKGGNGADGKIFKILI
jgi:hypothetical protein